MNISFDADKLYETMTNFYNLTKIRIVFFDDNFNKILSVPQYDCEFCTAFMENPTLGKHCISCDENARSVCRKTSSIYIYTCHAGLTEAIFPLKFNGIILGYIMLGQIIDKSEKKEEKRRDSQLCIPIYRQRLRRSIQQADDKKQKTN